MPDVTAHALDRLEDQRLGSRAVVDALLEWRSVVHLPASVLRAPHDDWTEFSGPWARTVLEDALHALPRRASRPLGAELARLDAELERKTSVNPFADPSSPWWARLWWH